MTQLAFITRPLCNRCNAETDGGRCPACGCPEFRLTGIEAAEVREEARVKPKPKRKTKR